MTIGYLDGSALAALVSPGAPGERAADVCDALDAICAHRVVEIEVPSLVGQRIDRMAWVWALTSVTVVDPSEEIRSLAVDLAWSGAPTLTACHVAAAEHLEVDHFVTADPVAADWATTRGLSVVELR